MKSRKRSHGGCEGSNGKTSKSTLTERQLRRKQHLKIHTGEKLYSCAQCDKHFTDSSQLARHLKVHAGEKPLSCPTCQKCFTTSSRLAVHLRVHTGEKPYSCLHCGKRFTHSSHVYSHLTIHTGEKPYSCKLCGKRFTQGSYLAIHRRIHTGEKPYSCSQCSRRFTHSSALANHLKIHTGEKPYLCTQCNKRFAQLTTFNRHKKSHTGEKSYSCKLCDKRYSQSSDLAVHLRVHTGEKPHSCSWCNKRFAQLSTLGSHVRIHTGEKPYSCSTCNKRFIQSSSLASHLKIHTGEKPYSCTQCNRCFSHSSSLAKHVRIHTGEKPKSCTQGDTPFTQSPDLARRLRIHTGEKPYSFRDDLHLSAEVDLCGPTLFPYVRGADILVRKTDNSASLVIDNARSYFQAGYYGDTQVSLVCLAVTSTPDLLSSSQTFFHPNITTVYGVTLTALSSVTLVMESVTTPLSHLLDDSGDQLSLRERLDIAVGCVSAVDYLHHQLGVSHGMVTCDYIFCSSSLTAKVLDPISAALINGDVSQTFATKENDIRQLGHVLLALFRDVTLKLDCDVCDESGQCCEPHRLYRVLFLMVNEECVPKIEDVLCAVEGMRQTAQYRLCASKHQFEATKRVPPKLSY